MSEVKEIKADDPLAPIPIRNNKVQGDQLHTVDTEVYAKEEKAAKEYDEKYGGVTGFPAKVAGQFKYGGNIAVNILNDVDRIITSGPRDPNWDTGKEDWIKQNEDRIPADQRWRYERTGNELEATKMLQDAEKMTREQELMARGGILSTVASSAIAGMVDIDTPVTLLTGGLSAGAKAGLATTKAARMFRGAAGGLLTGTALGGVEQQVNPTTDWTSIPMMGLGGMAFGAAGGLLANPRMPRTESAANESITKTLNDFGEDLAEDNPILKRDIRDGINTHDDGYSLRANEEEAARAEEFQKNLDAEIAKGQKSPQEPADAVSAAEAKTDASRAPRALTGKELDEAAGPYEEGTLGSEITGEKGSIGARQMTGNGPGINTIQSTAKQNTIKAATTSNQVNDLDGQYYRPFQNKNGQFSEAVVKGASRFRDIAVASGLTTDFDRLFRSGSEVAKKLAFDTMEHASGILRNNRSASSLMEHYHKQLQGAFVPYNDAFDTWAKSRGHGHFKKAFDPSVRQQYDREVMFELNARWHDGPNAVRQVDPDIKMAADAVDEAFKRDVELGKGKPGEGSVRGYDTITEKSGYTPQKWDGAKINKLIRENGGSDAKVVKSVQEFYLRAHPAMKPGEAKIFAQAAIDRARRNEAGISSNIMADMADADSRTAIEALLRRNGINQNDIDTLVDRLTGNAATRGQKGHTKERIKIDMRMTSSQGILAMDLFDTDLNKLVSRRMRSGAGAAALARKGISSKADRDHLIDTILEEQAANGNSQGKGANLLETASNVIDSDKHLTREELLALFSYFEGGPINGGVSPAYARMMKLTRLATLNGLGMTQMAETATTMGAVGLKRFFKFAGREIQDSLKKADSPLVQELKHMNILVPEEKLFRDDLVFDAEKEVLQHEWLAKTDRFLNQASRLQGFTSGFYAIRNLQQRVAVTAGADKIVNGIRKGELSAERAFDMGLDQAQIKAIDKYIRNKIIEFEGGDLKKLNLDKWDPQDAENFALNLNRVVNQDIQKAMVGESALIFHKDGLAGLFFQLKAFPMLAMEKQAYRHLRIMDQQAMSTFLYGLGLAGAVYTARQTISGRTDKLSWGSVANGAFSMSNLTGWIPMWVDPVAGMLGFDDAKFNQYGKYGSTSVVSIPASLTVLDRMAQIPGRAATLIPRMVAGDGLTYDDVQAFKATPIIGNAYGFSALWNALQ